MNALLQQLAGGDRRSIGAVPAVVRQVLADPAMFSSIIDGMTAADPLIRMRCADAAEKITARRPELLAPFRNRLLRLAGTAQQQEVRWHLAQLLSRLELSRAQRRRVVEIMSAYLDDDSSIVKTFAMQTMADIAGKDESLRGPILKTLQRLTRTGTPAMRSRGRKLLAELTSLAALTPTDTKPRSRRRR